MEDKVNEIDSGNVKKPVKNKVFSGILASMYTIINIVFMIYLCVIDILALRYVVVAGIVLAIITLLVDLMILKTRSIFSRLIEIVLIALTLTVYVFVYHNYNVTLDTLNMISQEVEQTEVYYLVVNKEASISSLDDIVTNEIYLLENGEDYTDIIEQFGDKEEIVYKYKPSLEELYIKVLSDLDAGILISNSQYEIICELSEEFKNNIKIVHQVEHVISDDTSTDSVNPFVVLDDSKTIDNGVFNIYISGIDTSGSISNVSRTDANIILTVNLTGETAKVHMTSVPRDYYLELHSKNAYDKLTHSGLYGIEETVASVEDLLDIDINYYVRVNFTTLVKIVDTLGGITVDSDFAFKAENYYFSEGINYLNGSQALAFARERKSFEEGDVQRNINQQKVIEGIMSKALSDPSLITKYTEILSSLENSFQTNITPEEITQTVKRQTENFKTFDITTYALTGLDSSNTTYSAGSQKLYVMLPDQNSLSEAKDLIKSVEEGK